MPKKNQVRRLKDKVAILEAALEELRKEKNGLLFRNEELEIIVSHSLAFATAWFSGLGSDRKFWGYTTRNQFRDLVASLASNGFDVSAIDRPLPGSRRTEVAKINAEKILHPS